MGTTITWGLVTVCILRGGAWDPVALTSSQVQVPRPSQNGNAVGRPLAWQWGLEHDPVRNCTHCHLGWTDHNRRIFSPNSMLALLIYVVMHFIVRTSAGLIFQDKTVRKNGTRCLWLNTDLKMRGKKIDQEPVPRIPLWYLKGWRKWDDSF